MNKVRFLQKVNKLKLYFMFWGTSVNKNKFCRQPFSFINNLKSKYQIMIFSSMLIFLSLLISYIFAFSFSKRIILQSENKNFHNSLSAFQYYLNHELSGLLNIASLESQSTALQKWYIMTNDILNSNITYEESIKIYNSTFSSLISSSGQISYINGIYLVNNNDENLYYSKNYYGFTFGNFLEQEESFLKSIDPDTSQLITIKDINGTPEILLIKRVIKKNTRLSLGFYVMSISTDILTSILNHSTSGQEGKYFIMLNNTIIGDSHNDTIVETIKNTVLLPNQVNEIQSGEYYIKCFLDQNTDLKYVYHIDKNVLFNSSITLKRNYLFAFSIIFLIVSILGLLVVNFLTKRLSTLVNIAEKAEVGDFSFDLTDESTDEVGMLSRSLSNILESIHNSISLRKEKLLYSLLAGTYDQELFDGEDNIMKINFQSASYQIVLISYSIANRRLPSINLKCFSHNSMVIIAIRPDLICILSLDGFDETKKHVNTIIADLETQYYLENCKAFYGSQYSDISLVKKSFDEAVVLFNYRQTNQNSVELKYDGISFANSIKVYPISLDKKFLHTLNTGNLKECNYLVDTIREYFTSSGNMLYNASYFLTTAYLEIFKQFANIGIHPEMLFGQRWLSVLYWQDKVFDIYSAFESLKCDIDLFLQEMSMPRKNANVTSNPIIRKALSIISEEYANTELSTTYIADKLSLNNRYFSSLFKREVGYGFSNYINYLRVQKAKALLNESNLKIKEISDKIGYSDPNYFCTVFKSIVGVSPKEFQKG